MESIIREFTNKKICIWGWGREGKSSFRFINKFAQNSDIVIADDHIIDENNINFISQEELIANIDKFDIIIKSPGISLYNLNIKKNQNITSQIELFLKYYKYKTIGITGTKGKSTTTNLIYYLLKTYNDKVQIGGNIGIPVFDLLMNDNQTDWYILELSCHQLDQVMYSPHIAVLLNIFPEHLDYYHSFELYKQAKLNIVTHQKSNDIAIINSNITNIANLKSEIWKFGEDTLKNERGLFYNDRNLIFKDANQQRNLPINREKLKLQGKHNIYNICAALLSAKLSTGRDIEDFINKIYEFQPLPHRLEYVGKYKDIYFYNDSISTIPQSTIAALESLDNVDTVIIGGMNRGIDYTELFEYFKKSTVSNIFCIGELKDKLYQNLVNINDKNVMKFDDLMQAVEAAYKYTTNSKICLLSPGAASYDQFKNFEERGDKYKDYIEYFGREDK